MAGSKKTAKRATAKKSVAPKAKARSTAKKTVKTGCAVTKTAAKKPAATQTAKKPAAKKKPVRVLTRKDLENVSEVSLTPNKISVSRLVSRNENGRYVKREVREYFDKTEESERLVSAHVKQKPLKKITVAFK